MAFFDKQLGEWRPVPGFSDDLFVSSLGWVKQKNIKTKTWFPPFKPNANDRGYCVFKHDKKTYRVATLIALAFIGPRPTPSHTVDHVAKYGGDFVKERSDNRAENIRWATKSEQSFNRNKQNPRRDGRAIIVWKVGTDKASASKFNSMLAACTALGLHYPGVKHVADGDWTQTKGFHVEYSSEEPSIIHQDEVFREFNGFFVSQYGRMIDQRTGAFAYAAVPTKGVTYASISRTADTGEEIRLQFHQLVAMAFPEIVGHYPGEGYTVDHKNRDVSDNRASNLRWANSNQQRMNQKVPTDIRRFSSPVEMKPPGEESWIRFDSMNKAAKEVNKDYGTDFAQATISLSIKKNPLGYRLIHGRHKGWSIRAAVP